MAIALATPVAGQLLIDRGEALRFFQKMTEDDIEEIVAILKPALSPVERRIVAETSFRVPIAGGALQVRAFLEEERRVVEVSGPFSRSLFMVVDAFILERETGRSGFAWQHATSVAEGWARNVRRAEKGLPPLEIPSPYEQLGFGPEDHARLDEEPLSGLRGGVFLQNLAFVVTHEIGHHILGHTDEEDAGIREDPLEVLQERIDKENEADGWATKTLIRAGMSPLSGLHALAYLYALDQQAIRYELARAHPADIRRLKRVVEVSIGAVRETLSERGVGADRITALERELRQVLRSLEEEIANTSH